ncbi:hypothetical protein ACQUSY_11040 [Microbacterium sp. YY-03]|uniref:hypothetical protein n=1 Tax=Microbacterium sp. YY-03 TaxID=3421636 RepID=UPI003D1827C2
MVAVVLYFAFSTEGIPLGFVGGVIFAIPVWFAARSIVRIFTDVANEDHTQSEKFPLCKREWYNSFPKGSTDSSPSSAQEHDEDCAGVSRETERIENGVRVKKIVISTISIFVVATVLYLLLEVPGAEPFLVTFGVFAGFTVIAFAVYGRLGKLAERRRTGKVVRQRYLDAKQERARFEATSPTTLPSTSPDSLEYPTDQPI